MTVLLVVLGLVVLSITVSFLAVAFAIPDWSEEGATERR